MVFKYKSKNELWSANYKSQSVEYESETSPGIENTRLHFLDAPFRIVATRTLQPLPTDSAVISELSLPAITAGEQIIWQTSQQAFAYQEDPSIGIINNVVLNVNKPDQAEYVGFGEQGGRTVLKRPTYMNYFCKHYRNHISRLEVFLTRVF